MRDGKAHHKKFGTLLSGPNGAGKSAAGVQAAMTCSALGLLVVYIPTASAWVTAAEKGNGDVFFFENLLQQNADLIAADPVLRAALAPALLGGPLDGFLMDSLLKALKARPGLALGVIVDQAQAITQALQLSEAAAAGTTRAVAADYFRHWQAWDTATNMLVRMDIASSHGARELKLPAGEEHRLRIVRPWTAEVVAAALSDPASPTAFTTKQKRVRDRVAVIAGGIPRTLFRGKQLLSTYEAAGMDNEAILTAIEVDIRSVMADCCSRWFDKLDADDKQTAADGMLQLVRGKTTWDRVKGLYDDGLVARCREDKTVEPVSAVAASVIIATLAKYLRKHRKPQARIQAGDQRGHELELQTLAALEAAHVPVKLGAKGFDGKPAARDVSAHADFAITFDTIPKDVTAHATLATLYIPRSDQFPCDAITVPASSSDADTPSVVWETSVTEPQKREEDKLYNMFAPGGIIEQLLAQHPTRPIVIALCWDGDLLQGNVSAKCRRWLDMAAAAAKAGVTVTIVVVGRTGLQKLGVLA